MILFQLCLVVFMVAFPLFTFSVPFVIYLNMCVLYSTPSNSKPPKSPSEWILLYFCSGSLTHAGFYLAHSVISDHELTLLGNFSKEILWRHGWFMFASARCLSDSIGLAPLYMTVVLILRLFRLQQEHKSRCSTQWSHPLAMKLQRWLGFLTIYLLRATVIRTRLFLLCGVGFFPTWSFSWECSPFWILT